MAWTMSFRSTRMNFCSSIVGATGVPYLKGNRLEIFNNGDEFYPEMLEAIEEAQHSITKSKHTFTGRGKPARSLR